MQRISALEVSAAPAASKTMLEAVQKKIGMVPNLFKTFAHSPAVLQFYLNQGEALASGSLPAALREQIALVTAGANGCDYCASAHTNNLHGIAGDAKTQVALNFAKEVVEKRGRVSDAQIQAVRNAGYSEAELVEITANVATNLFTNYFNHIAGTVIDFPPVITDKIRAAA